MLNFGPLHDQAERITTAVQEYLTNEEKQKQSDLHSVVHQALTAMPISQVAADRELFDKVRAELHHRPTHPA